MSDKKQEPDKREFSSFDDYKTYFFPNSQSQNGQKKIPPSEVGANLARSSLAKYKLHISL